MDNILPLNNRKRERQYDQYKKNNAGDFLGFFNITDIRIFIHIVQAKIAFCILAPFNYKYDARKTGRLLQV